MIAKMPLTDLIVVLVDKELPEEQAQRISRLSKQIHLVYGLSEDNLEKAHVVYTNKADFLPSAAPNLRWVQLDTVSMTHVSELPLARSGIPIANVRGAYSPAVAELAIALLLSMTRRLSLAHSLQLQSLWPEDYDPLQGRNCFGMTMGIVGYGSIGRHIARIAQAMGMNVLACKRHPEARRDESFCYPGLGDPQGSIPKRWFAMDAVRDMLAESEVLVVSLPDTAHTRGIIGQGELEALPPNAYLINVGRGQVIDELALTEHLEKGRLAGAALDVFATEPLPAESPLWRLPNVIVTPHIGSWTAEQMPFAIDVFTENLSRYLQGRPLLNLVDVACGY